MSKTMTEVLVDHQRQNAGSCLCGWAKLGHSHPEHQAEMLSAAGFGLAAAVKASYRFKGRATGSDPEGYYHPRWDRAKPVTVWAATKQEATDQAFAMLGTHPRFGSWRTPNSGWAIIWDSIDEEATAVRSN